MNSTPENHRTMAQSAVFSLLALFILTLSTASAWAAKPPPGGGNDGGTTPIPPPAPPPPSSRHIAIEPKAEFRRGDANADGSINIADPSFVMNFIFFSGSPAPTCMDTADTNDDGSVNIADGSYLTNALFFVTAPAIPAPVSNCGSDITQDSLGCASYAPCSPSPGQQKLVIARSEADYPDHAGSWNRRGYRPVWIDGYTVDNVVYFNTIFEPADNEWKLCLNMTTEEATSFINSNTALGYRIAQLESYERGPGSAHGALLEKTVDPLEQRYFINLDQAAHAVVVSEFISSRFRLINVAVAHAYGEARYTSLWEEKPPSPTGWASSTGLGDVDFYHVHTIHEDDGRSLAYLNATSWGHDGEAPRYSAIWNTDRNLNAITTELSYFLSTSALHDEIEARNADGYTLRMFAGYEGYGDTRFATYWTKRTTIITQN